MSFANPLEGFWEAVFGEQHPQIVGCFRKLGIALQSSTKSGFSLRHFTPRGQERAQVEVGRGIIRSNLEGLAQGRLGFIMFSKPGVYYGDIDQGQNRLRLKAGSGIEGLQGFGEFLPGKRPGQNIRASSDNTR